MSVGTVYRPELSSGPWDAAVVGSGIGGLAAAALLAKAGKLVLVLERHYVAGGFTHTFRRPGYEWDVGVHYIGEVHRPRSVLRRVFDHVSEGRLQWARMPDVYDRVIIGDRAFDLAAPKARFIEELARHFPAERGTIDRYVRLVLQATRAASAFFTEKALPPRLGALARPVMARAFHRHSDRTTWEVLSGLGASRELAGVLSAQYGDYGLTPRQSSFAIQTMVAKHYFDGGNYPVGGASRIAASILPTIEKSGGAALVAAEVDEILVRSGRASGVRLKGGDEIGAPLVISDAGVVNTFGRLLRPPPPWAEARLRQVRPSVAHVCLYIGLEGSAAEWVSPRPTSGSTRTTTTTRTCAATWRTPPPPSR